LNLLSLQSDSINGLAGIFQFVSKAVPGARHDIERLRRIQADFEQGIGERDVIMADKGYQ
jgi:hypothetical protein